MSIEFFNQNYFALLSLAESFQVDTEQLNQEYRKLQSVCHPDKFVNATDQERLQALQSTSKLNEAFETLKSPLKRAAYLLSLQGIDPEEHNQSHLSGEFLLQQIELREQLEDIAQTENMDALDSLKKTLAEDRHKTINEFEKLFDSSAFTEAKPVYNKLQFLFKLSSEINDLEEKLLDY